MTHAQAKALSILNVQTRFNRETVTEQKRSVSRQKWMTDDEMENIIAATMRGTTGHEATTDECLAVVNSVMNDRMMVASSDLAGKGLLDIEYDPTKPPAFQITYKMRSDLSDEDRNLIFAACQKHESKDA